MEKQLQKQLEKERQAFDRLREGHEKKFKAAEEEIAGLKAELGVLQSAYDDLKSQLGSYEITIEELHKQLGDYPMLEAAVERLKRQDTESKKKLLHLRDADDTVQQIQNELLESHAEVDELRKENAELRTENDVLQRRCTELEAQVKLSNADIEAFEEQLRTLVAKEGSKSEELNKEILILRTELTAAKAELEQCSAGSRDAAHLIEEHRKEKEIMEAEIRHLKENMEEGLRQFVSGCRSTFKNPLGLLESPGHNSFSRQRRWVWL